MTNHTQQRCPQAASGCNYPEGECLGLCGSETGIEQIIQQRDELLAALQSVVDCLAPAYRGTSIERNARAVIAKVKGGAA